MYKRELLTSWCGDLTPTATISYHGNSLACNENNAGIFVYSSIFHHFPFVLHCHLSPSPPHILKMLSPVSQQSKSKGWFLDLKTWFSPLAKAIGVEEIAVMLFPFCPTPCHYVIMREIMRLFHCSALWCLWNGAELSSHPAMDGYFLFVWHVCYICWGHTYLKQSNFEATNH